jgi:hypothetical protein
MNIPQDGRQVLIFYEIFALLHESFKNCAKLTGGMCCYIQSAAYNFHAKQEVRELIIEII